MAAIMMLLLVRILMFAAGFLLWAITSIFPMLDRIREGWDGLGYWQIGVPIVLVMQLGAALVSSERPSLSPLWVLAGHALAMMLIHPAGADLGLVPLAVVFIGLPAYAVLFMTALIGRKLAGFLKSA